MTFNFLERKAGDVPWNALGAVILLASLMINLISIPMNMYNHEVLIQLSPVMTVEVPGLISGVDLDSGSVPFDFNRHLSATVPQGLYRPLPASTHTKNSIAKTSALEYPRHLSVAAATNATSNGTSGNGTSGCASGSAHGSAGGHHGPHPHDSLIFLIISFMVGAAVMQISARWPFLQQTVLLFVIGFVGSLIIKGGELQPDMGKFGASYGMWMDIDPHLMLFTLLPALLAGDAMTIDTSVAKRVGFQCIWLAGPGVIIGGFGTAAFLQVLLGWDFVLCLCAGAMLCATDPVAVVALLKELGASPIITVQIQGESLLNDGTAIVLYLISYNMMSGYDYDGPDVAEFLIKKAMMAWALGLFIGYFFFSWIRAAANKLDHASGMIQITLTLCCAYWSFIFVEGVLMLSGVLATVASSLVLAHHMWPYIVSPHSMHDVWHTFEALGNMVVFFLAGAKTGDIFLDIDPIDILNLLVIYIFLIFIRASIIFGSMPVLKRLSADKMPVTWQDATLMTWGGLRGAVGLALALAVNNDGAAHKDTGVRYISKKDGERVLFFVAGIAFLTTLVNATTAPTLVAKLGITALPQARQTLLKMFHTQLLNWSQDNAHPEEVTSALKHMLDHAYEDIAHHMQISKTGPASTRGVGAQLDKENEPEEWAQKVAPADAGPMVAAFSIGVQQNADLIRELQEEIVLYDAVPKDELHRGLLGEALEDDLLGKVDDMVALIGSQWVDEGMAKVVNQIFLSLVFNNYLHQIEDGQLRPGSHESEVLLTSVRISLSPYRADLIDFRYVQNTLENDTEFSKKEGVDNADMMGVDDEETAMAKDAGVAGKIIASWQFNASVALAILFNSLQVCAEEIWRCEGCEISDHAIWLILDGIFTIFFLGEFVAKFTALRCGYFPSWWNRFDFFLVWVGVFGLIMGIVTQGKEAEMAGKTRIIRIARVLRTLRFLRLFRLFHARLSADKMVSMELAQHLKKVTTLDCFIRSHLRAQTQLIKYFGGNGKLDEANETEIARCVLQSQVFTYKALRITAQTQAELGEEVFCELQNLHKRKSITESLSQFVLKAHQDGALSATETHAVLHPLNHLIASCVKTLSDRQEGLIDKGASGGLFEKSTTISLQEPQQTMVEVKSPESRPVTLNMDEKPSMIGCVEDESTIGASTVTAQARLPSPPVATTT